MKSTILFSAILAASIATPFSAASQDLVARGALVYTMESEEPIEDGVVIIKDGKISQVGPADTIQIPPEMVSIQTEVITPGLVDGRSTVGFSGLLNQPNDQEQVEKSAPMQPELRAIDAYNGRDPLVDWVRGFGVTTLHTGHGPGALIAGQTMVVKTNDRDLDTPPLKPFAAVVGSLGDSARGKTPGTRAKSVAMLRAKLIEAQEYLEKQDDEKKPDRDLSLEALGAVLTQEVPFILTAHRHQDIYSALRLQEEFGFELILSGVSEGHLTLDAIQTSNAPVLIHPTMMRPNGQAENMTLTLAGQLVDAGVQIAFQSGYEAYVPKTRVVLFEAALATAYGLDRIEALRALTIEPAKMLGIADRVGSLKPGKDGDLALYNGDPFEYSVRCEGVVIDGQPYPGEAEPE